MIFKQGLITWRPPFPLNNACAAYIHQWKYNIHLNNTKYNTQTIFTNISNTYIHVENLKNASLYNIVVQPYARNQFAPFSFPISSNTLPYQIDLKLLWTSGQRIYVLNGTANTEMTVDVDYVTNFKNLILIEDSNDNLYFTSENVIYAHDLSNNNYRILYTADYEITNLIYDSYSERFYYSNHVNKTIARITLQGFEETKYYLNSAPDEIMIDSELAKLCWHSKDIGVFCQDLGQTEINTLLITKVVNAKVTNVVMDTNSHKIIFTKYKKQ